MDEMLDAKSYNQNKHSVDPGKVRSAQNLNQNVGCYVSIYSDTVHCNTEDNVVIVIFLDP